jgi:hypothetical protein
MRELEALPGKPRMQGTKEERLTCEKCGNSWTRFSRRGRKPKLCSVCEGKRNEQRIIQKRISRLEARDGQVERAALARAGKAQRRQERIEREAQEQLARQETIRTELPALHERWNEAFSIAMEKNTPEAWRKAENLMTACINASKGIMPQIRQTIGTRVSETPAPAVTPVVSVRTSDSIDLQEGEIYGL